MVTPEKDSAMRRWVLLLAGLAGIGYQQYTGEKDRILLAIFTIMAGLPIPGSIISLIKNSPTISQSSQSPEEQSPTESNSSSTDS